MEWIARQDWSDGTLGIVGASYQSFIQYATAANAPQGLKAIFPEIACFDDCGSMFHPGGILNNALSAFTAASMASSARNVFDLDNRQMPGPSDIAYPHGMRNFELIDHVLIVWANLPVGHGGTFRLANGGEWADVAIAWLDWQLKGSHAGARWFVGEDCGLCRDAD